MKVKDMKCPKCREVNEIELSTYTVGMFDDELDCFIECYCEVCNLQFDPNEKETT